MTASNYQKKFFFEQNDELDALCGGLLKYALKHGWQLQAWAVFPNHYHFVAISPEEGAENLSSFLRELHSRSARWLNGRQGTKGRKVWHNYRETSLTYEKSYYARLNYVHQNAVKHGLVPVANQYQWCSASWFERAAKKSFETGGNFVESLIILPQSIEEGEGRTSYRASYSGGCVRFH